jgi:hypothetical protein
MKVAKQSVIKEVWIQNFFEELAKLASLIDQEYNVISFVRVFCKLNFESRTLSFPEL